MLIRFKVNNLVFGFLTISMLLPAFSAETCPRRGDAFPLSVVVFDGTPEELASLVPDESGKRSGYWMLDSIYDQKRTVTVLCKYADGHVERVDLKQRVSKCNYQINKKNQFSVQCN